jgi:ribosomal protein L18
MATRFYRAIFTDGDTKLNVGKDTKDLFEKSAGMPPTVGTLDSMANEAMRDVREGVKAFEYLVSKQELESASKRLGEAVIVGEFVPEIRTLPRDKKRQVLEFVRKTNQLISAIDVKDYTLAETLVKDLEKIAKDFDSSKPMAAIETSKQVASMHLAKARNAALKGDEVTLQAELTKATELWPRNPELKEMAHKIAGHGNVQAQAAIEFDQLLGQKNHRQIFDKRVTFISMLALDATRSKQLEGVLKNMQTIETALGTASAMAVQSNFAGAWESVEKIAAEFPDDTKLSQTRADLTIKASDFVRTLQGAQELERKEQVGSSLAWYLKAQKLYPQSDFAKDGVERLVKKILPQG